MNTQIWQGWSTFTSNSSVRIFRFRCCQTETKLNQSSQVLYKPFLVQKKLMLNNNLYNVLTSVFAELHDNNSKSKDIENMISSNIFKELYIHIQLISNNKYLRIIINCPKIKNYMYNKLWLLYFRYSSVYRYKITKNYEII